MPKRVALKDFVEVDATELSNFARNVRFASEHSQEDVSGFSATGTNEYLAGPTTQSLTVEFFGSYGTGEVHQVLEPIHSGRQIVPVKWRPDQTAVVSAANPEVRGNVMLFSYGPGATRGEVDTFEAVFMAVDEDGLAFFTTPAA